MKPKPVVPVTSHSALDMAPLPLFAMARFRRLMSVQGWPVDLPRLCSDQAYMHECLARAHTCGEEQLRRVALMVFADYVTPPALTLKH